jgi:hypothetical protein
MKSMTISPEKKEQIIEVAGLIGKLIGSLIATAIIAGVLYAILVFLIGLSITYPQVFGVILIIDFIKNSLKK